MLSSLPETRGLGSRPAVFARANVPGEITCRALRSNICARGWPLSVFRRTQHSSRSGSTGWNGSAMAGSATSIASIWLVLSMGEPARRELILRLYLGRGATTKADRSSVCMRTFVEAGYPVPRVDAVLADGVTARTTADDHGARRRRGYLASQCCERTTTMSYRAHRLSFVACWSTCTCSTGGRSCGPGALSSGAGSSWLDRRDAGAA